MEKPAAKVPSIKKPGLKCQTTAWRKDIKATAVSKQKFQETLYEKYLALQARNKEMQEELGKLHLKNSSSKASQEELIVSRQAQRALNLQLGQAERK